MGEHLSNLIYTAHTRNAKFMSFFLQNFAKRTLFYNFIMMAFHWRHQRTFSLYKIA